MARIFYLPGGGPVHLLRPDSPARLSWCGARAQFRHVTRDGTKDEVTCLRCLGRLRSRNPQVTP